MEFVCSTPSAVSNLDPGRLPKRSRVTSPEQESNFLSMISTMEKDDNCPQSVKCLLAAMIDKFDVQAELLLENQRLHAEEPRRDAVRPVTSMALITPVAARVSAVCRGKQIHEACYDVLNILVEVPKGVPIGMNVKKDVIVGIRHGSPAQGLLFAGDILLSINGSTITDDQNKTKDVFLKLIGVKNLSVQVVRMKCRSNNKAVVADGYQIQEGYEYEWAVMYPIRGLNLGLDIKEIDGKVYVVNMTPESLSSMSLCFGECIVDVGPKPELITSAAQATKLISTALERDGAVRICVEVPVMDFFKNMTRSKIQTAMAPSEPKDYPLPPDAMKYAERGIAVLKDCDEPKPIYIEPKTKSPNFKNRISFSEKTNEQGVFVQTHSRLLVKVPPAKTVESEAAQQVAAGSVKEKKESG